MHPRRSSDRKRTQCLRRHVAAELCVQIDLRRLAGERDESGCGLEGDTAEERHLEAGEERARIEVVLHEARANHHVANLEARVRGSGHAGKDDQVDPEHLDESGNGGRGRDFGAAGEDQHYVLAIEFSLKVLTHAARSTAAIAQLLPQQCDLLWHGPDDPDGHDRAGRKLIGPPTASAWPCGAVATVTRRNRLTLSRGTMGARRTTCVSLRDIRQFDREASMNIHLTFAPVVSLIAGILILVMPRLLNYIVAIYLIIIGLLGLGLFGLR